MVEGKKPPGDLIILVFTGGKVTRKKHHSRPKAKQSQQPQQRSSASAMASSEPQTQTKDGNLAPGGEDAADLSGSDVEGGKNKSLSIEDSATDLDTSGVTSPISAIPPKFNVDSDVLARSPMGSVADLTAVQSESEGVVPSSGPARHSRALPLGYRSGRHV